MISLPKLARLAEARRYDDLLEEVTRNGRPLPLEIRLRLAEPEAAPIAGLALAIQRVCELTYRPTPVLLELASRLLELQRPAGDFPGGPGVTALAFGALADIEAMLDALPGDPSPRYIDADLARSISGAAARSLEALTHAQREGDDGLIGDELDTTIALWRLLDSPRLGARIDLPALIEAAGARGLRHRRSTAQLVGRWDASGEPVRTTGSLFASTIE